MSTQTLSASLQSFLEGVQSAFDLELSTVEKASSDAGFRQYYRVANRAGETFIVMDASLEPQANFDAFLKIDGLFAAAGVNVPKILAHDVALRCMLLNDLGTQTYLAGLNEENAPEWMDKATDALVRIQMASQPGVLPEYDEATLRRELELFPEWYVKKHLGVEWNEKELGWWKMATDSIVAHNLAEAKVFVHRDFMPRNLMVTDEMPGVLDFQDALYGPVSYDIACLLKDAFISWGEAFVLDITIRYWEKARKAGIPVPADFGDFYRDIDFMGVQRHLKVLGIFARLQYRDNKPKYLEDAPRFVAYLKAAASRYRELSPLARLLNDLDGTETRVGYTF